MENCNKELTEFIKAVNVGIVRAGVMKMPKGSSDAPWDTLCVMDSLNVSFDVRVDKNGHVTDGQDVAAKLHFQFRYRAEEVERPQVQGEMTTVPPQV